MKEHLLDKRVVQRALQEGLLEKDVYQRMLDALPDLSHKVQTAAEAAQLEAASQASAAARDAAAAQSAEHQTYDADSGLDDDDLDDDEDDDDDDEPVVAEAEPAAGPADTLEMERPRIPGGYNPDF